MDALIEVPPATKATSAARQPPPLHRHERQARLVAVVSLAVMLVELTAGGVLNSMALIGDGLHTSTHAGAMLVAAAAYVYARRNARDPRFVFGTGKVTDLAGFSSGVALCVVALFIAIESLQRLIRPQPVAMEEAAGVAVLGLAVSFLSAVLLRRAPDHEDAAAAGSASAVRGAGPRGDDINLWAAYLHMVADVITSVVTIGALLAGAALGWRWLDPAVGLVDAAVVVAFAVRLLRRASVSLLDMQPSEVDLGQFRAVLASQGARVLDLKVWGVGRGRLALAARVAARPGLDGLQLRGRLEQIADLEHVFIHPETSATERL